MSKDATLKITTGNVAVDMIGAALAHYKQYNRTVKIVNLSKSYWRIFTSYMQLQAPELEIPDEGIQFNNVLIRRGTRFQVAAVECELNPLIEPEDRKLPKERLN